MRQLVFVSVFMFLLLSACSDSGDGGGAETCGGASRPCCVEDGTAACGAGLFCAAFDGATTPTCQPEGSREGNAECGEDVQCAGNSCNLDERRCRALPDHECMPEVGCAPGTSDDRYACVEDEGVFRCMAVGDGGFWDVCIADVDCVDRDCRDGRCSLGCDVPGDGTGPCAGAPESRACWECILAAVEGCARVCPDDAADVLGCSQQSGCASSFCVLETCSSSICWFASCADLRCEPFRCF